MSDENYHISQNGPSLADGRDEESAMSTLLPSFSDQVSVKAHNSISEKRKKRFAIPMLWSEALACFLALAPLIATFATLYPFHGKLLPQWPFSIGVNALLAIYTVVLKGAVGFLLSQSIALQKWQWFDKIDRPLYDYAAFDEATRGPLGAFQLLAIGSPRAANIWFGSLLVLVALLVDPFTQQVLQYTHYEIPDPAGVATIPRSNVFAGGGSTGDDTIYILPSEEAMIDACALAPPLPINFVCSSGNCTFPDYSSIGFCSSCMDDSNSLAIRSWNNSTVITIIPRDAAETHNATANSTFVLGAETFFTLNETSRSCNFSAFGKAADGFQFLVAEEVVLSYSHDTDPEYLTDIPKKAKSIVSSGSINNCTDSAEDSTWSCKGYGAATCQVYPCIRSYEASVISGTIAEKLVKTTPAPPAPFGSPKFGEDLLKVQKFNSADYATYLATLNTTCLTETDWNALKSLGYVFDSEAQWIPYNMTDYADATSYPGATDRPGNSTQRWEIDLQYRGCVYTIERDFVDGLTRDFLPAAWSGFLSNQCGIVSPDSVEGPQIPRTLYNWRSFSFEQTDAFFKNFTTSLSNYMRTNPGNFTRTGGRRYYDNMTAPVLGTVLRERTCLSVRWAWLALPSTLVVLTLVFFAVVLVQQSKVTNNVRTCISSPLPMMFFGPDLHAYDHDTASAQDTQDLEKIEKVARQIVVGLATDSDGRTRLEVQGTVSSSSNTGAEKTRPKRSSVS